MLVKYGRTRTFMVARLVLLTFGPPPPHPKARARHRGAKDDDRIEQLYWG